MFLKQQQHVVTENYHELRIETVDGATLPYMGFARGGLHVWFSIGFHLLAFLYEMYACVQLIAYSRAFIN